MEQWLLRRGLRSQQLLSMETPLVPFVIPSEAEGSAALPSVKGNIQRCSPRSSLRKMMVHLPGGNLDEEILIAEESVPPPPKRGVHWVFFGDEGIRAGWGVLLFVVLYVVFVISPGLGVPAPLSVRLAT